MVLKRWRFNISTQWEPPPTGKYWIVTTLKHILLKETFLKDTLFLKKLFLKDILFLKATFLKKHFF